MLILLDLRRRNSRKRTYYRGVTNEHQWTRIHAPFVSKATSELLSQPRRGVNMNSPRCSEAEPGVNRIIRSKPRRGATKAAFVRPLRGRLMLILPIPGSASLHLGLFKLSPSGAVQFQVAISADLIQVSIFTEIYSLRFCFEHE